MVDMLFQIMEFNNRRLFATVYNVDKPPRRYTINEEKRKEKLANKEQGI